MGSWTLRQLFTKNSAVREQSAEVAPSKGLIEVGDFRIDAARRTATLRGEDLLLTSEEFDVLVFLTGHPRNFVTPRTRLATTVTSRGPQRTEFVKALLSLRRKIDAVASGSPYLRTEPWVIYSFDPHPTLAG